MVRSIWLLMRFEFLAKWNEHSPHHAAAQDRPAEASADEPRLAKVERKAPM
jgi:hypothetical protein